MKTLLSILAAMSLAVSPALAKNEESPDQQEESEIETTENNDFEVDDLFSNEIPDSNDFDLENFQVSDDFSPDSSRHF